MTDLFPAETSSPEATRALGRALAACLEPGDVLALSGDLGAGKTCLARGIAEGLRLGGAAVSSPTFTLVHEHEHPEGGLGLVHVDLYRLDDPRAVARLGLDELLEAGLAERHAVAVVEWPERAAGTEALPEHARRVRIEHAGGDCRRFLLDA